MQTHQLFFQQKQEDFKKQVRNEKTLLALQKAHCAQRNQING